MAIGSQYAQNFRKNSAAEQKALAPSLVGAAQMLEPRCFANLLADSDRRAVLENVSKPRRIGLVARRSMNRAAMMDDHGACGNRLHGSSLRIEARVALDGVGFLCTAVQTVRKHPQQMRTGDVRHRAVIDRAIRHGDPNADFLVLET